MIEDKKIKEGFSRQKLIVLPEEIIRLLKTGSLTSALYFTHIGFFPVAKHHFVERMNGAPAFILIYCLEGKGWFKTEKIFEEVTTNQFFVLPKDTFHQYGAKAETPWSIYFLHFSGEFGKFIYDRTGAGNKQTVSSLPLRQRLFENLYNTMDSGYSKSNLEHVNMSLWQLLNTFIYPRYFSSEKEGKFSVKTIDKYEDAVTHAIGYMKKNMGAKKTLQEIASEVHLSISHFSSLFRNATGYSPTDYFLRLKIQHACQYLDLTDMQVKEIAYKLGIDDPYYFSRLFKRVMGISPRQYRWEQK